MPEYDADCDNRKPGQMRNEIQTGSGDKRRNNWGFAWLARRLALGAFLVMLGLASCGEPAPIFVSLIADGREQNLEIKAEALTVRDLLDHFDITLDSRDRVEPDLYVELVNGMQVRVVRVVDTFESEREVVPFSHQTMRSESVPEGERRLLQLGANGELEITYRVTLEDGVEVAREEVRRDLLVEPVDEIMLVGIRSEMTATPISGTIVYLSTGNAWVMRQSTDLRRNITGSGNLDGRVFALSPDGARLVFSRAVGNDGAATGPINSLWLARTSLVGEEPVDLGAAGVIWAGWAPNGRQLAYSTAERTGGVPGWKANNDLWLMTLPEEGTEGSPQIVNLLPPSAEFSYAWWGREYAWSPDGTYMAYAQADEVGVISLRDKQLVPLATYPPYRTQGHWAWVPSVSWSPDGYLLAFARHEGDMAGSRAEDSPVFGLWAIGLDGGVRVRLAEDVGMWAAPRWSPTDSGMLAHGQAQIPGNSQDSRYNLYVRDRDGSNARLVFPDDNELGLLGPDVVWSPQGDALLFVYEGNLYRVDVYEGSLAQLTHDGQSSHPRWAQ